MNIWEGVSLAFQQIRTEKLKSLFSLLGVILGVMFLIVVVTVVEGLDRYVREDFSSQIFGVNTVTLRRWQSVNINTSREERRERNRRPRLTFEDADALRERLTLPSRVAVESGTSASVVADNGRSASGVNITGASAEVFDIRSLEITDGRAFTPLEARSGAPVVVIGSETAELLYEGLQPVGRTLRIRGFPYRVIGVLEERGSLFGQSQDNLIYAPARSPIQAITAPRGNVDGIIIQAVNADQLRELGPGLVGLAGPDAGTTPTAPDGGSRLLTRDGGRGDQLLGQHFQDPVSGLADAGVHLARRGRNRDHEHHARFGDGADPRDRGPQSARSDPTRNTDPDPHRISHAVHRRGRVRRCGRTQHREGNRSRFPNAGGRITEMDRARRRARPYGRDHRRGLPRIARLEARPRGRPPT